jgi:outer membrane lipoprotein-sorting protein
MSLFHRYCLILLLLSTAFTTGCLFHTRRVEQTISPVPLKSATKEQLIAYVNSQASKIQTMQATVDIDTAVGGAKKGKVTEYKEIRGYVLARKPAMLRMIGLLPILRNTAFDMVSDGREFKVSIPPKNRFVVGQNDVMVPNPQQPLENLRPKIIYDALLLRQIDPEHGELAVLENGIEIVPGDKGRKFQQADYILDVVIQTGNSDAWLSRKIVFSRVDLLPHRQLIYDQAGDLVTDASYSDYKDNGGVLFPSVIEIRRPEEEYDITLHMVKLEINLTLDDTKFVLEKPAGAQEVHLDPQRPSAGGGSH